MPKLHEILICLLIALSNQIPLIQVDSFELQVNTTSYQKAFLLEHPIPDNPDKNKNRDCNIQSQN
jgi:hypothetical protein